MWREQVRLPAAVVDVRVRRARTPVVDATPAGLSVADMKVVADRAFERGREAGRLEVDRRCGDVLAALETLVAGLKADRARERAALTAFGIDLAVGLTRELVGDVVAADAHDIRRLVDLALETALPSAAGSPVTLRLNPDDLSRLENGLKTHPFGAGIPVQLVADGALSRGSVKVFSGGAEVDADLSRRLAAMAAALHAKADSTRA